MLHDFRLNFRRAKAGRASTGTASSGRGLISNISYSVAGQLGYVIAQMAVLAALARFKGAEAIGQFGIALAVTTPIFMLTNMGLRTSQASDIRMIYAFSEYAGVVLLTASLGVVLSVGIGYTVSAADATFLIVLILSITKAFEAVSHLSYGAFQQAGRMDKVATSLLIRGTATAVVFVALLSIGFETSIAFLAQLFVWSTLAIIYDYPRASRISSGSWTWPSWHFRRTIQMMWTTAPLGAGHFMNSLLVSMPRLFVNWFLGLEAVGLFTVVGYFQQAGALVINAVSQALVNGFARIRHDGEPRALRKAWLALLAAAIPISALGILFVHYFGEAMLGLLFGPEFRAISGVLMLIAIAVCVRLFTMLPQSLMHADRRFGAYFWYQAASVIACIGLLIVCVPLWGLTGAGISVLGVSLFRLTVLSLATLVTWRGSLSLPIGGSPQPRTEPDKSVA